MENKIRIVNDFIEGNLELTVEELYVFSHLYTLRTFEEEVISHIDTLNKVIKLSSSARYNKEKIRYALTTLQEYGIINLKEENKSLFITFNEISGGYTFVPYDKVRELSPIEFFIYVAVAKWENPKKGTKAKYSYSKWAELLDCDERTAVKYVNSAIEKGVIFKSVGSYNKKNSVKRKTKTYIMQEVNTYSIVPFTKPEVEEPKEFIEDVQIEEPEYDYADIDDFILKGLEESGVI